MTEPTANGNSDNQYPPRRPYVPTNTMYQPTPSYHPSLAGSLLTRGRSTSPQLGEMSAPGQDSPTAAALHTSAPLPPPSPNHRNNNNNNTRPSTSQPLPYSTRPHSQSVPSSPIPSSAQTPHAPPPLPNRAAAGSPTPRPQMVERWCKSPLRLYYSTECTSLAQQVAHLADGKVELCQVEWKRFADGWPNLQIQLSNEMKWFHVAFLASFHSPEVFFEQYAVASYLPKLLPKSFKLLVPFFAVGTMERVTRPGEIATASTMARLLSTVPSSAKGPAQISFVDMHALSTQFFFRDSVLVRLTTAIPLLLQRLRRHHDFDWMNCAFPDDGASKRFGDQFADLFPHPVVCQKVRDGTRRVVSIKEGEVAGKHVVIVDDLVQSGGTLIECAKQLRKQGARKVSAYVTHVVFPKGEEVKFVSSKRRAESWKDGDGEERKAEVELEMEGGVNKASADDGDEEDMQGLFDRFWCTDSNPIVANRVRALGAPFEVLSLAPMLVDILLDDVA